jgi:hypothetical protein
MDQLTSIRNEVLLLQDIVDTMSLCQELNRIPGHSLFVFFAPHPKGVLHIWGIGSSRGNDVDLLYKILILRWKGDVMIVLLDVVAVAAAAGTFFITAQ